jgi:hypothetical protein
MAGAFGCVGFMPPIGDCQSYRCGPCCSISALNVVRSSRQISLWSERGIVARFLIGITLDVKLTRALGGGWIVSTTLMHPTGPSFKDTRSMLLQLAMTPGFDGLSPLCCTKRKNRASMRRSDQSCAKAVSRGRRSCGRSTVWRAKNGTQANFRD